MNLSPRLIHTFIEYITRQTDQNAYIYTKFTFQLHVQTLVSQGME